MRFVVIGLVLSVLVFVPQFAVANTAPVANANGPYGGVTNQSVSFNGSASFDADGDFLTYSWDFGDGADGIGIFPSHAYADPGTYIVSLVVNDGTDDSTPATTEAVIGLAPPSNPVLPKEDAGSVVFPLVLKWEEAPGAESYFYNILGMEEAFLIAEDKGADEETSGPLPESVLEFLSSNPYEEYRQQCDETKEEEEICSDEDIQRTIVQEQTYFWRVKACSVPNPLNPEDTSCGPYSNPPLWSFVYIPQPPENLEEPIPGASSVSLPVRLQWTPVENVGSYLIDVRVDTGSDCSLWDRVVGFFFGGFGVQEECDPFEFIAAPLEQALHDWLGAGEGYDPSCPWLLWNSDTEECSTLPIPLPPRQDEADPEYLDDECVFSKNTFYLVTVASCVDERAQICGEWSEQWSFETGDTTIQGDSYTLSTPELLEPEYDAEKPLPVVGKTHLLRWKGGACGGYVRLLVSSAAGEEIVDATLPNFDAITLSEGTMEKLWANPSDLNKEYVWSLRPCWRIKDDIRCELGASSVSDEWHFKTIGEPPLLETPENGEFTKVPSQLSWKGIDGVGSYKIEIASDEEFENIVKEENEILGNAFTILFEDGFRPDNQYWWRVASCADTKGEVCGNNWSEERSFRTHPLLSPTNPNPGDKGEMLIPGSISWQPDLGASYYQYHIEYVCRDPEETLEECMDVSVCGEPGIPKVLIGANIISSTSAYLSTKCTGQYQWAVASCADKDCAVIAPDNPADVINWTFIAQELPVEERFGLVPCGRNSNNPKTPYNEKEACGVKHVGFLLQNILDFVLWKLSLIILAVLAVFVAASTYFSFGSPEVITRMRSVFRSYFYGVLILLFAWLIVNIIMAVFGFNVNFFGNWYEIPF